MRKSAFRPFRPPGTFRFPPRLLCPVGFPSVSSPASLPGRVPLGFLPGFFARSAPFGPLPGFFARSVFLSVPFPALFARSVFPSVSSPASLPGRVPPRFPSVSSPASLPGRLLSVPSPASLPGRVPPRFPPRLLCPVGFGGGVFGYLIHVLAPVRCLRKYCCDLSRLRDWSTMFFVSLRIVR